MSRIIFIHGFGEKPNVFDQIAPSIGGQQIFIDVWSVLGNAPRPNLNIVDFSQELINRFSIDKEDVVIGHSMGGWIAYHIKQHTGCRIVQIGSWTEFDRILSPIKTGKTIYWMVRRGWYINRFQKWLFVRLNYKNAPSRAYFESTFEDLITGNKENIVSQLKLMFEPVPTSNIQPDLRIHARKDSVIKYPREAFHEVPGDHFTLVTHPDTVIKPILDFLKR
jgi:pimeloyl-ACP methyl ester carboxylesterase